MDLQDPIDRRATALFAAEAEIADLQQAADVLGASDAGMRDHYRRAAMAASSPFLYTDSHFRMGTGHEGEGSPCQDWATHGFQDGLPFAIVSDGCSTSGRTDLGARFLALAATGEIAWAASEGPDIFQRRVLDRVSQAARLLGTASGDLDATLVLVMAEAGGGARAVVFGDGVVVARGPQGMEIHVVEWAGNMPGYPGYAADPVLRNRFIALSDQAAREAKRPACTVTRILLDDIGTEVSSEVWGLDAEQALSGIVLTWPATAALDSLSALTDGVGQFSSAAGHSVATELTAFKASRVGEFVRRRMTKALALMAKRDQRPIDDIAIASIATGGQANA